MKSVKNFGGSYSSFTNCNFLKMTHLIVQVGVQIRLLWMDNCYVYQVTAVVTIYF